MKLFSKCILVALCISVLAFCLYEDGAVAENKTSVKVKVGKSSFKAVFYDNDTARALLKKMPVKYKMSELNGNEKYKYLGKDLPTDEKKVKKIKAGDIMLYGSDCLVVFYKSFRTSYEYTPIGRITKTKGLKKAAGRGKITIRFSRVKQISLSKSKLTLSPGQSRDVRLKGVSKKKVRWSTSNSKVATVSKGTIKAKKTGRATITAKFKNKKYRCRVTVSSVNGGGQSNNDSQKSEADIKNNNDDGSDNGSDNVSGQSSENGQSKVSDEGTGGNTDGQTGGQEEGKIETLIGDKKVNVRWENNESVMALKKLVSEKPLTIQMTMYGGFEQVGPIGTSLPSNDVQMTTAAGDIVLYSGNQLVVFYGSNSWSYTKLGHITDQDEAGMKELLGNHDVKITIRMEESK